MDTNKAIDVNNLAHGIKQLGLQARASANVLSLSAVSVRQTAIRNAADELLRSKNEIFIQKKLSKILDKMKISSKIKLTVDVDPINFT